MKYPKHIPAWLVMLFVVLISSVAMEIGATAIATAVTPSAAAVPRLPESELTWKNVTVGGKKTAVFSICRDSRGIMWIGTNSGLYFYDGVTAHPVGHEDLSGIQIYSIIELEGRLYLGTNNGLLGFDYNNGVVGLEVSVALPKEIRSLLLYDNKLWVGSLYGLFRLDLNSGKVEDYSIGLPHKSVYSILRDSRGILYVGTYNGLARFDSNLDRFAKVKSDINNPDLKNLFVNCLLESPETGNIYIGSEGALYEYSPVSDRWRSIAPFESNNIKSLARGSNGHILIGTDNGVFDWHQDVVRHYRHDSRYELSLSDNEIWCVFSDGEHNIWAGHERGFSMASTSTIIRTIKLSALAHTGEGNEIHTIYRDSRNDLWLGGTNGAIRLSEGKTPNWYRHSDMPKSLSHNRIRSIDEDSQHNIWLSTDGGLNRYEPAVNGFDVFHVVDKYGEHNSNWVYSFEEEADYYWVGSFLGGVHRVEKSKFNAHGGTVVSDYSINADSRSSNGGGLILANDLVNNMIADGEGNIWILLFRDSKLAKYTPSIEKIETYDIQHLTGSYPTHICRDNRGRIWCAFNGGAILFDSKGSQGIVNFPYAHNRESILAVGKVGDGIWVSTQDNVWSIDGETLTATLMPIPQKSYTSIYEDDVTGMVLLGATDEILEVDYRNLGNVADYKAIKLALQDKGKGNFDFSGLENSDKAISIPYGGNITMVVSTLDYSPDSPQRFMYKLAESEADTLDDWIVMPDGSNTIALSDLKMGDYLILVKTVGYPIEPTAIRLSVSPPWALSWWAICLYVAISGGVIVSIILYMRKRSQRAFQEQERQAALENVERKLSFLSEISHDLKTPLSMILGPVSIMKEKAKDPESKRTLETVYDNAVRLNNMIHRTLEIRHLEDGDEDLLILSTFDVVEFCNGVFEVFKENNSQKNFVFHSAYPQLLIEADAVKFESVITNLLSNACKYSHEGSTISCGINVNGNEVEITVSDDGVGIADIDQPFVFQRMYRASSTSSFREGTGLGLYLIKKYLELMKGNIALYSKEGQGTTFVVTLPMSEKVLPTSTENAATDNAGNPKILVVEDNSQISGFISEILKDDYTCFVAENGRSGLAIASSINPDLIIVDEMMPIMNGMEMVKRIKQHPRLSSVPIIMLTAKSDNKTENESIKLGIDVFMAKPFEPTALVGRIKHLLKGRTEIKEKVRIQTIAEAESKPIEAESVNEKTLAKIAKVIEDNISDQDLNVNLLCEKCGIPNKQLYRLIKKYMGVGPLDYIRRVRLQKAAVLLSQHRFTVAEICYMVGFKTPSYFAKCFQNQYGVTPSQYQSEDESVNRK